MSAATRPMTPAERYYAFLDQAWPMNIMLVAELDRHLPGDLVEQRWREFSAVRVLPRMMATSDLAIADAGTARIDFRAQETTSDHWDADLARESLVPYGLGSPLRCRLLTSPEEGRSRLFFIGHHSVVDGRSGVAELQAFIRLLDGQAVTPQVELSAAAQAPADRFAWQTDKRELIALLREISTQNRALGAPAPTAWPPAGLERRPRFGPMVFDPDEARALLQSAKVHGARAFSAMAAAWLVAVAEHVVGGPSVTIQLNTPVDVSTSGQAADRPAGVAIGVLSHRFAVQVGAPWPLAADIATAVARSVERGEGDLFFHLARTDRVEDLETGARLVAESLAAAPPAVSVTNLGIIDPGSDPAWLRSMCGYQAPTPNQVAFVSGLGYRGQLVNSVSTDDSRLPAATNAALLAGYRALVGQMSGQATAAPARR